MPPSASLTSTLPLTLIVAATPEMGIGLTGALPWPSLKSEMAYFARVTRRAPAHSINAVVMGRRTWESIPEKSRPLKGRLNVVISRDPEKLEFRELSGLREAQGRRQIEGPVAATSIADALVSLRKHYPQKDNIAEEQASTHPETAPSLHRVFIIGGAEIYAAALAMPSAERILLTRIRTTFQCDTFFPLELGEEGEPWTKKSRRELDECVGEELPDGLVMENGVEWDFELWEKQLE